MRILKIYILLTAFTCDLAQAAVPPPQKSAPAPTRQIAPVSQAIPLLEKGVAANEQRNFSQAEQYFKQALSEMGPADPNNLAAFSGLAASFYNRKLYPQALFWARKSHPLFVKRYGANSLQDADSLYLIATLCYLQKNFAEAENTYQHAISIYERLAQAGRDSSNHVFALHNLGVIKSEKGEHEAAIAAYQKALTVKAQRHDADTGALLENIGISYQHLQRPDEAVGYFQRALDAYGKVKGVDSPEVKRIYFTLANIRPSVVPASQNAEFSSQYNGQYYKAGKKAYNADKDYDEAARQFKLALEQALRFYPDEHAFVASLQTALGQALYMSGGEEAPEPYLEKALAYYNQQHFAESDPKIINLHTFLGFAYQRRAEYELAEKHFQQVLDHAPRGTDAYFVIVARQAEVLCHEGRFEEGRALYNQALVYYRQSPAAHERAIKGIEYHLALLDKMFQSSSQGLAQYFEYSVNGLRRWNDGQVQVVINSGQALNGWHDEYPELVRRAFREWQAALGDQLRFEFTDDPEKSDVIVSWADKPISESQLDAKVGIYRQETVRGFFLKSEIALALSKDGKPRSRADIYAAALHEIGHMLGLSHSANLSDIMSEVGNYSYSNKDWPTLSARDVEAARTLYRQKPVISNPKGITLAEYQKFNQIATEGTKLLKANKYREAFKALEAARSLYADDPYINFYCGLSAFQKGDYKEARKIFESAPMPEATSVFSVDKQLGLIYIELGHHYNGWGKKNREIAAEFYDKGVQHLKLALQQPNLPMEQQSYLLEKLKEGQMRKKPEPLYYDNSFSMPVIQFRSGF
jgi:tetratricopeptide (TPR) repeat protein